MELPQDELINQANAFIRSGDLNGDLTDVPGITADIIGHLQNAEINNTSKLLGRYLRDYESNERSKWPAYHRFRQWLVSIGVPEANSSQMAVAVCFRVNGWFPEMYDD